jgi:hypothetical protein
MIYAGEQVVEDEAGAGEQPGGAARAPSNGAHTSAPSSKQREILLVVP